jgi:hypothetical protein
MNNDLQFKYKYLKYKLKYVKLKKQLGGGVFQIQLINNENGTQKEIELDENQLKWKEIRIELKIPENVEVYYLDSNGKKNIIKNDKTYEKAYYAEFGGGYTLYYETPKDVKDKAAADASKKKEAQQSASKQASDKSKEKAESERQNLITNIEESFNDLNSYFSQLKTTNPDRKGRIKNIFPNEFVNITDSEIQFSETKHRKQHDERKGERGQTSLNKGDLKWMTINLHLDTKKNSWVYQVSIFKYVNTDRNNHNFQRYVFGVSEYVGSPITYETDPDEPLAIVKRRTFDKRQIQSLLSRITLQAITTSMDYSIRIAK